MINEPNNSPILALIMLDPALRVEHDGLLEEAVALLRTHAHLHTIGAADSDLHSVCIDRIHNINEQCQQALATIMN